jgi:uncharacterized membrane protein HdeD (DUF308 family)
MADRAMDRFDRFERGINELWWIGLVQAALAIFFGVTAIFWPGLTLVTLVYLFSGFILAMGLVEIIHGLMSISRRDTWWLTLLIGLIGLAVGVYLMRHPDVSFRTFILVVGLALVARGVVDIMGTFVDNRRAPTRALLLLVGAATVVAGVVIMLQPVAGGVAFVWVLGLYALIYGAFTMALALSARAAVESLLDDVGRGDRNTVGARRT